MKKALLLYIIVFGFAIVQSGCTSKKVDQDGSEVSELSGEDSLSDEIGDVAGDGAVDGEAGGDDFAEGSDDIAGGDEAATDDLDGLDATSENTEVPSDEPSDLALENNSAETTTEPTDTAGLSDDSSSSDAFSSDPLLYGDSSTRSEEAATEKKVIPLQKMYPEPYKSYGKPINAMYVARVGDTVESVSRKIYGDDRSEDLKKINPTFARRDMKVGDKVYYNSPQRPDDMSTMQTYYEDMGLAPEVYLSQPGDNIRKVSKNLLGHENSWKEIWATNPDVDSKWDLQEGTRLRYWPGTATAPVMANQDDQGAPAPVAEGSMDSPPPMGEEPPPMPEDVAAAPAIAEELPVVEEPPQPIAAAPPPPPVAAAPPPPPPRPVAKGPAAGAAATLGDDPDQLMALGAGAILLLAVIFMFIIIKKKRAKKNSDLDFQTATHTQIE